MKVLVEIPDKHASFGMEVLKSLSFVKKADPFSKTAARLWKDLEKSAEEIRLHKQGKTRLKTAQEIFDEL